MTALLAKVAAISLIGGLQDVVHQIIVSPVTEKGSLYDCAINNTIN